MWIMNMWSFHPLPNFTIYLPTSIYQLLYLTHPQQQQKTKWTDVELDIISEVIDNNRTLPRLQTPQVSVYTKWYRKWLNTFLVAWFYTKYQIGHLEFIKIRLSSVNSIKCGFFIFIFIFLGSTFSLLTLTQWIMTYCAIRI